jgi:P-type Mg2+ transporter
MEQTNTISYATRSTEETLQEFKSSRDGLTQNQAAERLRQHGFNELNHQEITWWKMLLHQLPSSFNYLLGSAAIIAFLVTGDWFEGCLIVLIIICNNLLSFYQEYKASRSLALLKALLRAHDRVIRDGQTTSVESRTIVPGDIVLLEPGDIVPADLRVIASEGLLIDESSLTGETVAVAKSSDRATQVSENHPAPNICFAGTTVVAGKAIGLVIATGLTSSLGQMATLIAQTERESTFTKNINKFSKFIVHMVVITFVLMYIAHLVVKRVHPAYFFDPDYLIFFISLAVTIVPEMLPSVITISLARGAQKMAENKVVVKRLTAIEDLGSIDILCTDKTGTLTENILTLADIYTTEKDALLKYALLSASNGPSKKSGGSFDDAIISYCEQNGVQQQPGYTKITDIPFEPARRRSSVLIEGNGDYYLIVRGAYEELLKSSVGITEDKIQDMVRWVAQQGSKGCRVVGIAVKKFSQKPSDLKAAEENLTWYGLISFVDPIKKSTFEAVTQARALGLRIKILTGDSPEVAGYVGEQIKLIGVVQEVMTGEVFAQRSSEEKRNIVERHTIFARISPQQKLEIIKLLQEKYEVGFLGDGINDAPALKAANVAIVVQGASDIAQEAADIVLLKKSLMVIINGIVQGRTIFANTVKYIKTSLTGSFGHFYAVAISSLFVDYVPMLPLQILLMNILSDIPLLAISTDTVEISELKEPKQYNIREIAFVTTFFGLLSSLFDFLVFITVMPCGEQRLQTVWFIESLITETCFLTVFRSKLPLFKARPPSNTLIYMMIFVVALGIAIPFIPFMQTMFGFVTPYGRELGFLGLLAIAYIITMEYAKMLYYRLMNGKKAH